MTEFSPKAIEQLNQTVREVSRRVRNEAPPRARWQKRKAPSASATGGSSGGGGLATNNCCGTIYQAGSVDLDGLEWATDYTITLAAPIGTVTVTDQGSGTWESDAIDVTCTVDEVTVTDEYTVTMTATGNAPGEVIVTVALTSGGGYGGAAGCCATTEGGFAWKYVNCCIVDPLAGWSMTRDPSGFSGKECEIGGCEICVTPKGITSECFTPTDQTSLPAFLRVEFSGFTDDVSIPIDACSAMNDLISPMLIEFYEGSVPSSAYCTTNPGGTCMYAGKKAHGYSGALFEHPFRCNGDSYVVAACVKLEYSVVGGVDKFTVSINSSSAPEPVDVSFTMDAWNLFTVKTVNFSDLDPGDISGCCPNIANASMTITPAV